MKLISLLFKGWFSKKSKKLVLANAKELIEGIKVEKDKYINDAVDRLANLKVSLVNMEKSLNDMVSKRDSLKSRAQSLYNKGKQDEAADFFVQAKQLDPQVEKLKSNLESATKTYDKLLTQYEKHIREFDTRIVSLETKAAVNDLNKEMAEFNRQAGVSNTDSVSNTMKEVGELLDSENTEIEATTEVCDKLGLNEIEDVDASFDHDSILNEMKEVFSK